MNAVAWVSSLALAGLAGMPLLSHRAFTFFPMPTRLVLAGAAGAVFVSFAMTAAVLVGVPWSVPGLVLASAALGALLRLVLPSSPEARPSRAQRTAA